MRRKMDEKSEESHREGRKGLGHNCRIFDIYQNDSIIPCLCKKKDI